MKEINNVEVQEVNGGCCCSKIVGAIADAIKELLK